MKKGRISQPVFGKGKRLPYTVSCAAWIDLLGYGKMLEKARFDPTDERAQEAVERLYMFHRTVAAAANRYMRITAINDAAVSCRDLSYRSKSTTFDALARFVALHQLVNKVDLSAGYCGARMVIAVGMRITSDPIFWRNNQWLDDILRRLSKQAITTTHAVREAFRARPVFGVTPELQANFAFSKAYLADNDGKKAGLKGPHCFIDLTMFDENVPDWIDIEETIPWSNKGMSCTFGKLSSLDRVSAGACQHVGILGGFDIAKKLFASETIDDPWMRLRSNH